MKRKKNAFTLIELLAVIVILAVIALIATPIILGIVEDAKKDAFLRSVELLVSTTDIDIANKTFEEEYTYEITDGNISNLEVSVKNTDGMNGSITYDVNGKEVYAIHNGVYCVRKTANMSKAEISEYKEDECLAKEDKRILKVLTKLVPNENTTLPFQNGQLIDLGKYGIRYQGSDPDNYVYFNCSDYSKQSAETCEVWRIVGVVDGKVKLVNNNNIGKFKWDETVCDANGENCESPDGNWATSTLNAYLNGEYLTSLENKNNETVSMIDEGTWYLKASDKLNASTRTAIFDIERTDGSVDENNPEVLSNTKIGLPYVSDTLLSSSIECDTSVYGVACNSWMTSTWTIMARGSETNAYAYSYGISTGKSYAAALSIYYPNTNYVVPSLYLTQDVQIIDGTGSSESPYQIK